MSTFAVTIEKIGRIWEHENADALEMASLAGKDYSFVVGRGDFTTGDLVVYFPIDSALPEWICDTLHLTGKLAGSERNRVKTIRLRGNISQGIVCKPSDLAPAINGNNGYTVGDDLTELLGVTKYEPPVVPSQFGDLKPLPGYVSKYDVENAQSYVQIIETFLMDQPCFITEKLEGSHWSATLYTSDEIIVSQRNFQIIPVERGEHDWYKVLRTQGFGDILKQMKAHLDDISKEPINALTLRGEMLGPGVQANYYQLKEHEVRIFEIEINGDPVNSTEFLKLAEQFKLPTVPILAENITLREWLKGQPLTEASNGTSLLSKRRREGVVIKPMHEDWDDEIGRVMVKQRSPDYLAKTDW